jgi:hypothetical protein
VLVLTEGPFDTSIMKPTIREIEIYATKTIKRQKHEILQENPNELDILVYLLRYQSNRLLWNMYLAKHRYRALMLECHPDKNKINESLATKLNAANAWLISCHVEIQEAIFRSFVLSSYASRTANTYARILKQLVNQGYSHFDLMTKKFIQGLPRTSKQAISCYQRFIHWYVRTKGGVAF